MNSPITPRIHLVNPSDTSFGTIAAGDVQPGARGGAGDGGAIGTRLTREHNPSRCCS